MQTGNMLSGASMSKTEVHTGVSFDQLMAQRIGDRTRIPSLVLGCEGPIPGLQDGHPLLYSSHISWSTAVSLVTSVYSVSYRRRGCSCRVRLQTA